MNVLCEILGNIALQLYTNTNMRNDELKDEFLFCAFFVNCLISITSKYNINLTGFG